MMQKVHVELSVRRKIVSHGTLGYISLFEAVATAFK